MLEVWTRQLAESAQTIDAFRYEYFESFIPHFKNLLAELLDVGDIELIYYPGWDRKRSLQDALEGVIRKDKERGFTSLGHHRADMIIKVAGVSATEVLSRGEQKLVASALMLTQGQLLRKLAEKKCTYLVDDLASELDPVHRKRLCGLLERIDCQVVITAVDEMALAPFWTTDNNKLFHVKHGKVTPQEVL
jgi:DNA replication and repair protein RecF